MRPVTIGRDAVRVMRASDLRSSTWLSADDPQVDDGDPEDRVEGLAVKWADAGTKTPQIQARRQR